MGKTKIEWCDMSVNPIRARWKNLPAPSITDPPTMKQLLRQQNGKGHYCEKISPGCANCYASKWQPRFGMPTFDKANLEDLEVYSDEKVLQSVLRRKEPTTYFWEDMSDLFGHWVREEWIDECAAAVALTPQHTHMWLTKRPERLADYFDDDDVTTRIANLAYGMWCFNLAPKSKGSLKEWVEHGEQFMDLDPWPLPNLRLGVSVENQDYAWRIEKLLQCPAACRFISAEPLLGPLRLPLKCLDNGPVAFYPVQEGLPRGEIEWGKKLDWVIAGSESGPNARPYELEWFRSLRNQCRAAGVPFFLKQLTNAKGRKISFEQWPADLQVREWPR